MRKLIVLVVTIIAGCATQPTPHCINVPGEGCKKISAGNVGGTTIGHNSDEDIIPKAAALPSKP